MILRLHLARQPALASSLVLVVSFAWWSVASDAIAQVVQLPSVRNFSYSGSVSAPDQGSVSLGGSSAQRTGSSASGAGPLASRSTQGQSGAASMSVSATVIDLQAMDQALLAFPAGSSAPQSYAARPTGTPVMNTLTPHLYGRRSGAAFAPVNDPNAWRIALGAPSTPDIGYANSIVHDDSEIRYYMLKAREATATGRLAAAQVYYRLAYERLSPDQLSRLQEYQRQANEEAKKALAGSAPTADGENSRNDTAAPSAATSDAIPAAAE